MEKKLEVTQEDINRLLETFGELNHCNIWSRVTRDDFTVRRFPLGFVNDILCCELTNDARERLCRTKSDYTGLVVKYAPKVSFFEPDPVENATILTMVAENGLGPQAVYISEKCQIQQYIKSNTYSYQDDCDEETVRELARLLARFHALKPPVSKNTYQRFEEIFDDLESFKEMEPIFRREYLLHVEKNTEFKEKYYDVLKQIEIKENSKYLRKLIKSVKAPHVFIHRDFNRGNRLVTTENGGKTKRIYLVDFDYSTYNHRGFDFGRYFSNFRHRDDMFGNEGFPTDQELELFLDAYRLESSRILGLSYLEDPANSLEQLRDECKLFTIDAYFGDVSFGLMMYLRDVDGLRNDYFLNIAKNRYEGFLRLKKQFVEDGSLARIENGGK